MTYYKKEPIDLSHVKRAKELVVQAQGLRSQGGDNATTEVCLLLIAVMELVEHADNLAKKLLSAENSLDRMSAVVN